MAEESSRPQPLPPVIVVGLDSVTGLQVARILARRGVRVAAIAEDRREPPCFTRRVSSVRQAAFTEEDLPGAVVATAGELGSDAVLFPCSDEAVLALSRSRNRLSPALRHGLGEADTLDLLLDKIRFVDFAARAGLRAPRSAVIADARDAARARAEVGLPCVAKPAIKSRAWSEAAGAAAVVVHQARDLDALIDRLSAIEERWILQEWIPGGDDAMYSTHTFHAASSEPVASTVVRKLRQWPPGAGSTTLAVHVSAPDIEAASRDALARAGWTGLCELEWKRHAGTGELFVIEANPARATLNLPLAEASGVELVTWAYRDAAGLPPEAPHGARRLGTRWIWWRADRASAAHYQRTGELSFAEYVRSLRGRPVEAEMSWSDPLPFLLAAMRGLRRRLSGPAAASRASPSRSTAPG